LEGLDTDDPAAAELVDLLQRLGTATAIAAPLIAHGTVIGVLVLVAASGSYTADELRLAEDVGRRAGTAIDNARLYRAEHDASEAVQRSLLPSVPQIDGLAFAARYLPAVGTAAVGGDWFDVLALPDGTAGVAIGDVMGHDLAAAAAMGQLRSVLRSYAWEGHRPAAVLDRLDLLVQALGMAQLATCLYAWIQLGDADLEPPGGQRPAFVQWANAGHLPPLLLTPDGGARFLGRDDEQIGVLIGAGDQDGDNRPERRMWIPSGSHLLLYTDGLVESRELDLDDGLARLCQSATRHCTGTDPDVLVHDANSEDPTLAFALSRLTGEAAGVTPIGVFRDVDVPTYDEKMAGQIDDAKARQGDGDLMALIAGNETWKIG
nr:SpoIIE family protein phosphatase [Micromonospora sp. DSM 115978]